MAFTITEAQRQTEQQAATLAAVQLRTEQRISRLQTEVSNLKDIMLEERYHR